jgi:prepilin-type N-terminal cleavage/methylation domain-containing protein
VRPNAQAGYTLVEVVIAILLTAVIVTAVFSVSLSSKTGDVKAERKLMGAVGTRQVASMLRNYVAGVRDVPMGPGDGGDWSMTIPSKGIVDHFGTYPCLGARNDYALTPGDHCLTGVLGEFENPPYNARVWYHVEDRADAGLTAGCPGCMLPAVTITAEWVDP